MKRRNIIYLFVFLLAIIIIGVVIRFKSKDIETNSTGMTETQSLTDNIGLDKNNPESAYLSNVTNEGYGLAKRIYIDKEFIMTINANLLNLDASHIYEGWLVRSDADGNPKKGIPLGKLTKMDQEFFLFYQSEEDLRLYNKIIICKESTNDEDPEEVVIVGYFAK